jgi:hypothetical protein
LNFLHTNDKVQIRKWKRLTENFETTKDYTQGYCEASVLYKIHKLPWEIE